MLYVKENTLLYLLQSILTLRSAYFVLGCHLNLLEKHELFHSNMFHSFSICDETFQDYVLKLINIKSALHI